MQLKRRNRQASELDMWLGAKAFTRFEGEEGGEGDAGGGGEGGGDTSTSILGDTPNEGGEGGGDAGGESSGDWRSGISDEYRETTIVKEATDINGIIKSAISAQAVMGLDKVAIPGKNATPEQVNEYHMKLGRPEAVGGYEVPDLELGEGQEMNKEAVDGFLDTCFKQGLSQPAMAAIIQDYGKTIKAQMAALDTFTTEQNAKYAEQLKSDFGNAHDQKIAFAKMAIADNGDPQLIKDLNETGAANRPSIVKLLAKLGQNSQEGTMINSGKTPNFVRSPAEANALIDEKLADKDFHKSYMEGDKSAVAEMAKLHEAANPPKVE